MSALSRGSRRFATVILFALAVAFGVDMALAPEGSSHQILLSIGFAIAGLIWCGTDARIHGWNLVWPARLGILIFGPLGLMAYIVWSRGKRGLLTVVLGTVVWLAIELVAYFVTSALVNRAGS